MALPKAIRRMAPDRLRDDVRLRSVDRSGRLARWRGDSGGSPSLRRRDGDDGTAPGTMGR